MCQEWPGAVTVRREVFLAIAEQHQAAVDKDARKYGECLARLRVGRLSYGHGVRRKIKNKIFMLLCAYMLYLCNLCTFICALLTVIALLY